VTDDYVSKAFHDNALEVNPLEQRLQALGPQPFKAHGGARVHYERHRLPVGR
jgi:hypothetical protein